MSCTGILKTSLKCHFLYSKVYYYLTLIYTKAFKNNTSVLGIYFEWEEVKLYLVTKEAFVVQTAEVRRQVWSTPHLRTP